MKKFFLTTTCLLLLLVQVHAQKKIRRNMPGKPSEKEMAETRAANIKKAAATQFQYFIIKADSGSFGYSIYANGNLFIQQNTIPSMGGNKGFPDTVGASKTAQFVIRKIKEGEMPPSVTASELKQLKIIQ